MDRKKGKKLKENSVQTTLSLTEDDLSVAGEVVFRDFHVNRSRAETDTARGVVVRTVARAEPTVPVTSVDGRDATEVSADTDEDEPFGLLDTHGIGLRVTEGSGIIFAGSSNFLFVSVTDEDGLTTPLDGDGLTDGDLREVDFDLGHGHDVGGGSEGVDDLHDEDTGDGTVEESGRTFDEVSEVATRGVSAVGFLDVGAKLVVPRLVFFDGTSLDVLGDIEVTE